MFGLIGSDVVGGDGHDTDAVAALDLEFLDGLKMDFAVGGFLANEPSLREDARGKREERQGFNSE
jgi:hypothetical protein